MEVHDEALMGNQQLEAVTPVTRGATVPPHAGIVLLNKLIEKAEALLSQTNISSPDIGVWENLARDYLTRSFGPGSPNINAVLLASGDGALRVGMTAADILSWHRSIVKNKIKYIYSFIEQLQTEVEVRNLIEGVNKLPSSGVAAKGGTKVFVVHGHNHGVKEAVARFIERIGLQPVILHEQANKNRTVIEKFLDYADVHFAVVLLTGDDEGRIKDSKSDLKPRARQNVLFELGFFLGKLDRARVCALYEPEVEVPSDIQGVLFVELSKGDQWKFELVRELQAAGFDVDANKVYGG